MADLGKTSPDAQKKNDHLELGDLYIVETGNDLVNEISTLKEAQNASKSKYEKEQIAWNILKLTRALNDVKIADLSDRANAESKKLGIDPTLKTKLEKFVMSAEELRANMDNIRTQADNASKVATLSFLSQFEQMKAVAGTIKTEKDKQSSVVDSSATTKPVSAPAKIDSRPLPSSEGQKILDGLKGVTFKGLKVENISSASIEKNGDIVLILNIEGKSTTLTIPKDKWDGKLAVESFEYNGKKYSVALPGRTPGQNDFNFTELKSTAKPAVAPKQSSTPNPKPAAKPSPAQQTKPAVAPATTTPTSIPSAPAIPVVSAKLVENNTVEESIKSGAIVVGIDKFKNGIPGIRIEGEKVVIPLTDKIDAQNTPSLRLDKSDWNKITTGWSSVLLEGKKYNVVPTWDTSGKITLKFTFAAPVAAPLPSTPQSQLSADNSSSESALALAA